MQDILYLDSKYRMWWWLLVLAILIGFALLSRRQQRGRGFCSMTDPWIPPQTLPNFLSPEERKYILDYAESRFEDSRVVTGMDNAVRKSQTAWIERDDPVVKAVIERVCRLSNIPFQNAEKMQVVKYGPGGYYNAHFDASCDDTPESIDFEKNGGQRVLTVLCYLNDDFEDGATHFPNLKKDYKIPMDGALLFYSLQTPESGNQCHPLSLHAGMPVSRGEKYICNIWIREREYTP